jgi:hypothetical protein
VKLLLDVLFEVRGERQRQCVAGAGELARTTERRLGQRHRRADDLVLLDQVLGPQLGQLRMVDERTVGRRERANGEGDLPPEANARGVGSRAGSGQ